MRGEAERHDGPLPPAWRQAEYGIEPIPERAEVIGIRPLTVACHDHDLENLARMNRHLPDGTCLYAADTKRALRLRDGAWTTVPRGQEQQR